MVEVEKEIHSDDIEYTITTDDIDWSMLFLSPDEAQDVVDQFKKLGVLQR